MDGRTDGQTGRQTERKLGSLRDMTKLTVAFRNFAKMSEVRNGGLKFVVIF